MRTGCEISSNAGKDSVSPGTLKMKAARSSETSEEMSHTTCNNPGNHQQHRRLLKMCSSTVYNLTTAEAEKEVWPH